MTLPVEEQKFVDLSWDGLSVAWKSHSGSIEVRACEQKGLTWLPELSDMVMLLNRVYLPMEWLLVRHVSLPLKSPKMVDADMLFQELAESSDLDADDWWLTWRMDICDEGVAGMVFGLPEALRQSMQETEPWKNAKEVLVDGYERLQTFVVNGEPCAVVDQDDEGVFFGFYDGQVWRGMRRLNGHVETEFSAQLLRSWIAMGFSVEADVLHGRACASLLSEWKALGLNWQGECLQSPLSRHHANVALVQKNETVLNFRHGRWAVRAGWDRWKPWWRSAVLAAAITLIWIIGTWSDLHRMDAQVDAYKKRIEVAFHQGLPNESVMLDALAQLRQAAGGSSAKDDTFLLGLQAVSEVYQKVSWTLTSFELRDGQVQMSGHVKDIQTLNQIQSALKQTLARDVNIVDTNITGRDVAFRMHW